MFSLIKDIMKPLGVSGRESRVAEVIKEKIAPYVDEVYTDALGNLIAHKKGPEGAKKLMFAAHMDEIGFFVTAVDGDGNVRFSNAGGIRYNATCYHEVVFENGTRGVLVANDSASTFDGNNSYVDIGAKSKKEAEKKVKTGDTFAVVSGVTKIGAKRLVGRPFDDRIGCAILVEAAKRVKTTAYDTYYVFTVQEEVGCRGSETAAYAIMPDIAVAVDITKTGDTPGSLKMDVKLGGGAAIKIKDNSVIADPKLVDRMIDVCKNEKIKYQLEILTMGGTDTSKMQSAGAGCSAGCISVPTRFAHTPVEMIDVDDVEACVKLTVALVEGK